MTTLYTDISVECCAWLGSRVEDGSLPPGDVLLADVRDLSPEHVSGYDAVHLFAGIGGMALGFAWAEWPTGVTLLTGGFPCQDVSTAGKGLGLGTKKKPTARSGLFWELVRLVGLSRPEVCLCENVGAVDRRGMDTVAGALGEVGYFVPDAYRVGAWAVGAPHERERWWIVGYRRGGPESDAGTAGRGAVGKREKRTVADEPVPIDDAARRGREGRGVHAGSRRSRTSGVDAAGPGEASHSIADPVQERRELGAGIEAHEKVEGFGRREPAAGDQGWGRPVTGPWRREREERLYAGPPVLVYRGGAGREECNVAAESISARHVAGRPDPTLDRGWPVPVLPGFEQHGWEQPRLRRGGQHQRGLGCAVHGLPGRLADALNRRGVMACGNAVVPQVVAAIARGIKEGMRCVRGRGGWIERRFDGQPVQVLGDR